MDNRAPGPPSTANGLSESRVKRKTKLLANYGQIIGICIASEPIEYRTYAKRTRWNTSYGRRHTEKNEMETIKQNKRKFKNSSLYNPTIHTFHRSCRVEPFESFRWNVSSTRRSCLFDFRERISEAPLFRWINFVNQPAKLIDREPFSWVMRGFSREREKSYSIVQFRSFCGCDSVFNFLFICPFPLRFGENPILAQTLGRKQSVIVSDNLSFTRTQ